MTKFQAELNTLQPGQDVLSTKIKANLEAGVEIYV